MRIAHAAFGLCLIVAASSGEAADNTVNLGTLNIVHRSGLVENETFRARWSRSELAPKMGVEIRNTEKVKIVILDPNTLLFRYDSDGVTKAESENFKNAKAFSETLGKLGTALGSEPKTAASLPTPPSDPSDVGAVREFGRRMLGSIEGSTIMDRAARAAARRLQNLDMGKITALESRDLDVLVEYRDAQAERQETIKSILDKYKLDPDFREKFGKNIGRLSEIVAGFDDLTKRSAGDRAAVQRIKQEVEKWELPQLAKDLDLAFKEIDEAEFDLLRIIGTQTAEDVQKESPALFALSFAKDQERKVRESLDAAEAFAARVFEIDVPKMLEEVSYEAGQVSTLKFTIQPVEDNASVALKSGRKTGTFEIDFAPRSPVQIGFGGAAVYSFVEKPEFSTEEVGDKFMVVRKEQEEEYVAQNVAAVLTLTPRGWFDPEFGAGFFVGVTPEKDELGFYLGASIRLYRLVNFGLGWTYQQVPALADGLTVGSEIAAPEELKLDTEFEGGWFLSLNFKFN